MKCPYCQEEMEAGIIQSPHEIRWQYKKHFFGRAEFHEGSIVLSELSFLKGSAVQAFCCRRCEKIVIDYKDRHCDMNRKMEQIVILRYIAAARVRTRLGMRRVLLYFSRMFS